VEGPLTVCDLFPAAVEYASSGVERKKRGMCSSRTPQWLLVTRKYLSEPGAASRPDPSHRLKGVLTTCTISPGTLSLTTAVTSEPFHIILAASLVLFFGPEDVVCLSNISTPFRRNATVEAAVTVCLHSDWDGNHRFARRMGIVESGCSERGAPYLQCRRLPSSRSRIEQPS
jgi:hypothetical protein